MPEVAFTVDQSKSMADQAVPGHNRWHPDVPAANSVRPGSDFRVECREWTDAQIGNNDSANDVRDVNLGVAHMLSGPIAIEGAEPGDLLVVEILDLGPCQPPQEYGDAPGQGWGYTGIFARDNGGGFLTDHYPDAHKAIWDFRGQDATSRHVPGVRYTGITHPGPVRDRALGRSAGRVEPARAGADRHRPRPRAAAGTAAARGGRARRHALGRRAGQGRARGRAHGARAGERRQPRHQELHAWKPRLLPGARGRARKLSGGDLHFSQGDGEITFCGAIEMGGFIDFGVDLIKDGMNKYGVHTNPVFIPGRVEPRYSEFISFIGISVDEEGDNHYLDATIAYRRACLNAIEYLKTFGYTGEQAYLLLGSAPIEGRISGIVDIPNACCSLYLPTEIFDFDIRPTKDGPTVGRPRNGGGDELRCRSTRSAARRCGPFERLAARRRGGGAFACPSCGGSARRRFTPPGVARMPAPLRGAREREEKSAHEPEVVSAKAGRPMPWAGHHGHAH